MGGEGPQGPALFHLRMDIRSALGERAWWKEVLQLIPESPHTTVSFSFVGLGTHTGSSKTGFDKRLIHSLSNIFLMCFIVVKVTAYYFYHV